MHSELKPGSTIEGKYRIERVLGVGGMGMVVAAQHTILKQRVALKFILDKTSADGIERFLREARATARLESPHVCRIMDAGKTKEGSPFIVMEMLQGTDLAQHLIAFGALPIKEAIGYMLQVLDGLAEAHRSGIVHRDLKPGNLFLAKRSDGSTIVKLLDFGISKLHKHARDDDDDDPPETMQTGANDAFTEAEEEIAPPSSPTNLTATGVAMGSPPYMSPEQLRSTKEVDARCDIWAMGTILYELLTARRMFPGAIPKVADILAGRYTPMRDSVPSLPIELEQVVARCLRVEPSERYASATELAAALKPFINQELPIPPTLESAAPTVENAVTTPNHPEPPPPGALPGVAVAVKRTMEMPERPPSIGLPIGLPPGSSPSAHGVVVAPHPPSSKSPGSSASRYIWPAVALLFLMSAILVTMRFAHLNAAQQPSTTAAPAASSPVTVVAPEPTPPPSVATSTPAPAATPSVSTTTTAAPKQRPRVSPAPKATKPSGTSNNTSDVDLGRL